MLARPIHWQVTWVKATKQGRGRVGASSEYIRRCNEQRQQERSPLTGVEGYVTRDHVFEGDETDVAEVRFFCRGSHRSADIWAAVDRAFRTECGEYSRRGGTPRMALFIDALLPQELSEEQKVVIGNEMAEAFVARYGVCVEVAWHKKADVIDHVHFLVSTRSVDEDGVGKIVRALNGVASKCSDDAVLDGKKKLAGPMEWMRAKYSSILTRETGQLFDPRSYERQNNRVEPVRYVSRQRSLGRSPSGSGPVDHGP